MPEVLNTTESALVASLCRESFYEFVQEFWDLVPGSQPLKPNWHIRVICNELQSAGERVFAGLPREADRIVNLSPGSSKSSLASILFPAWVWTRMPKARVMTASHTDVLVMDLANKSRAVIKSEKYQACFPGVQIRADQDTKGYYVNNHGGDRFTCTVGGKSPMGMHAHILIVDDPLDPKRAASEAELKAAAEFMTDIINTRKVDKEVSVTFLIMQRLAVQDPTGVLLERSKLHEHAAPLRHFCLPATTEGGYEVRPEHLRKHYEENGGLMDPARLPRRVLLEYQAGNQYGYAAQFGQNPQLREGALFKEHYFNNRVPAAPFDSKRIRFWDRAATDGGGCRTAGVLLAKSKDGRYFVENVVIGQWETYERNARMRAVALRDRNRYGPEYEPVIYTEAEGGSSGRDAWRDVARALAGFTVKEDRPTGRKEVRAEPWSSQLAAGNVWLVEDGTWDINEYVREHVAFPDGQFADQVDSSSGAFNLMANRKAVGGMRTIPLKPRGKKSTLKIVVCRTDEVRSLQVQQRTLLVNLADPQQRREQGVVPFAPHLLGTLDLDFADLDPAQLQEVWDVPVEPWNETPEKLIIDRSHAKKLWAFLLKRWDLPAEVIVVEDDRVERGKSVAYAICDGLHLPRAQVVHTVSEPDDDHAADPPRRHVYATVRAGKALVVS